MYKVLVFIVAAVSGFPTLASIQAGKISEPPAIIPPVSPFSADRQPASPTLILRKDALLSKELLRWTELMGYRLLWNSNRDYLIYNTIVLAGKNIDETLYQLGQLLHSENYGLVIRQYELNKVLVIDTQ